MARIEDLKYIIEEAAKVLPNGEQRFDIYNFKYNHQDLCHRYFNQPEIDERIASDYGIPTAEKDIENDFYEEISTLEKLLEKHNVEINLADWQKTTIDSGIKLFKGMNRRAYAIQLWENYAIPIRYRNDYIYIIYAPQDVMGTPIIHSRSVKFFISDLITGFEKQSEVTEKTQKLLSRFMWVAGISLLLLIPLLWNLVERLFR